MVYLLVFLVWRPAVAARPFVLFWLYGSAPALSPAVREDREITGEDRSFSMPKVGFPACTFGFFQKIL
jgi:hypothetical protein